MGLSERLRAAVSRREDSLILWIRLIGRKECNDHGGLRTCEAGPLLWQETQEQRGRVVSHFVEVPAKTPLLTQVESLGSQS